MHRPLRMVMAAAEWAEAKNIARHHDDRIRKVGLARMLAALQRAGLALAITACASGTCIDAPPAFRSACAGDVAIQVVTHRPSPAVVFEADADRLALLIDNADRVLAPHGVRVELVAEEVGDYVPAIVADTPDCDALHTWDDRAPRDGRLHVYAMHTIRKPGARFEGYTSDGVVALAPDASPLMLAHEIGHVFGLGHSDDARNLMYPGDLAVDLEFNAEQGAEIRAGACSRFGGAAQ